MKRIKQVWDAARGRGRVPHKLSDAFDSRMHRFARLLQEKSRSASTRRKWGMLLFFSLVSAITCIWLIVSSLQQKGIFSFFITPIRVMPLVADPPTAPIMNNAVHQKVHRLMDSLQKRNNGKHTYRLAGSYTPTRLDTLVFLDSIYHRQTKTK